MKWKIITSNPQYKISNTGKVWSLIYNREINPTIHKRLKDKTGYFRIELKNPRKKYLVHRLVAEMFIKNPNNYPIVNHRDGNGYNNNFSNLEWCTNLYNVRYSLPNVVVQVDLITNEEINVFPSCKSAGDFIGQGNQCSQNIHAVCQGKRQSCKGYGWKFKVKTNNDSIG